MDPVLIKRVINNHYPDRFSENELVENYREWEDGEYEYNFGDFVFDSKYKQYGVIVKESKCYIWVWYFDDFLGDNEVASKRLKDSPEINITVCCNLDSHFL